METTAFGLVDGQLGFMPAKEGIRLHINGTDELGVPQGEEIVEPANLLFEAFADKQMPTFTTQDWHPRDTAHFSDEPNFQTNWPRHCVAGTPGAQLHPGIKIPPTNVRFIKGMECLERGEDDLSYSGYYAIEPVTGISLPGWLHENQVKHVILGGLALDYCVRKTAIDIRTKLGLEVTVVSDATRGIAKASIDATLAEFKTVGIRTATTNEVLRYAALAA